MGIHGGQRHGHEHPPGPAHAQGHAHDHAHDHGHGHGHAALPADAGAERRLRAAFALTAGFMAVEVAGGLYSGALALLADAGHMFTDAGALALALYALRVGRRPPDARRTFGYGRARVLAAFVNGLALLAIAGLIAFEALQRLWSPLPVLGGPMLAVASAGLAVNLVAFAILHGAQDLNSRAALAHVASDLLASVAAILAALAILATGWTPADPLLSLAVAALILRNGLAVAREAAHELLEGSPAALGEDKVRAVVLAEVPGVLDVHHVHAWSVGPGEPHVTLHVRVGAEARSDAVIGAVTTALGRRLGASHVTVQVECEDCASPAH